MIDGYYQCICRKGHYYVSEIDYDSDFWFNQKSWAADCCPICYADAAWENLAREDDRGLIPIEILKEKFLISPEVGKKCDMGHYHITSYAIFRIPKKEETDPLRTSSKGDDIK